MRRYVGPLIALAIFIILLLFVLLTQNNNSTTQTAALATPTTNAAVKDLQILSLTATDPITELNVKTMTGTLQLKLDSGQWKELVPKTLSLDSAVITDTVAQLRNLAGASLIPSDKAGDLATFGLDKPTVTVMLVAGSGPKTLLFGSLNPATNNYYVKRDDDPKVWTVSSFVVNTLVTWLTTPPTPAPTIALTGSPLTPLPSVTPSPTVAPPTTPAAAPVTTVAPTTAGVTTGAPTTTEVPTTAAPGTTKS